MPDESTVAHQNLIGSVRVLAGLEDGTDLLEDGDLIAVVGEVDWPTFRLAYPVTHVGDTASWIERAETFVLTRGKSLGVFTRVTVDDELTSALTEHSYRELFQMPEMLCTELAPVAEGAPGPVAARLATTPQEITAYAGVAAKAFSTLGFPEEPTRDLLDNPVLLSPDIAIAIAELDGAIVAGAMSVMVGDGGAYAAWVATLAEARGTGLGDAVTRLVTAEAFRRGATTVSLEASGEGKGIYRRMGYRELYDYRLLIKS